MKLVDVKQQNREVISTPINKHEITFPNCMSFIKDMQF